MKKNVLIVAQHLTIGGVQKSLISISRIMDYDKYDVTLYLRKNRLDLLPYIDKRMNVLVNDDSSHYYRRPCAVLLQLLELICKLLGFKEKEKKYRQKLISKISEYAMKNEHKKYFKDKHYDIAVAYLPGYITLFVDKYIDADKKYAFSHSSTDDFREIMLKSLPNYDKMVSIHQEQKADLLNWYPFLHDKTEIVEHITDRQTIIEQSKEFNVDKPSNKAVLCSCGRFAYIKGFDIAVEAARVLKQSGEAFVWYIIGDGPEKSKIEELIKNYSLEENVILTGMLKNPYPYMAASDVYIQPSREESLGLTMLEAHRLATPVISTETMGGLKLINPQVNGLLCKIDAVDMAEKIKELINDKQRYDLFVQALLNTDFSNDLKKYKEQWTALLEG